MSNVCSNLPACSTRTTRNALSPEATERHDSTYELSRACSYIWPGPTRSTRPMSAVPSRGWKSISWCQVMVSATAVTRPANPRWRASSNSSASVRSAKDVAREKERSEEHTSELQSHSDLVCRLQLEKKTAFD